MTPKIQPLPLSKSALKALSAVIIRPLCKHMKFHKTCALMLNKCKEFDLLHYSVHNYIPATIMDTLLDRTEIYATEFSKGKLRRSTVQLLLNENCSRVTLYDEKEMRDLSYWQLKGLKSMTINFDRDSCFTDSKLLVFQHFLSNLRTLVTLKISMDICEETLETIGIYCKHLKELEVSMSLKDLTTGTGFVKLAFADYPQNKDRNALCLSLQSLHIGSSEWNPFDENLAQHFLIQCTDGLEGLTVLVEQLLNLRVFYFFVAGHVLSHLYTRKRKFSLQIEEISDTLTNKHVVSVINILPNIKSIQIFSSYESDSMLRNLTRMPNLRSFILGGPTEAKYLNNFLTNHGNTLEKLYVMDILGAFNLSTIADRCPKLTELHIGLNKCTVPKVGLLFPHLQILTLDILLPIEDLIAALKSMQQLKELSLLDCTQMRQKSIAYIVKCVSLDNLESITLSNCGYLNMISIDMLLHNYDKLKRIGNMNDFNCSNEDLDHAKSLCYELNLDVEFVVEEEDDDDEDSFSE